MKYVTDGATYTCPASFLFRAQAVLAKSNGEGKALLTTAAKLVSTVPGVVCPRLPKTSPMNPPFICPCVVVPTSWEHPDKKNTAGGNMLLTEDSTKKCPETQEYFKLLKNPNNLVQDGAPAVSIAGIVFPKLAEVAMAAKPSQAKAATPSPVASGGKVSEPPTEKQGKTQPTSKKEQQGGASEGLPLLIGPLCPGCHRASCKYAEASTMSRENSSQKLREAYQAMPENEKDDYDRYYDKLASEKTRITPWSFAAHHIISGNQVFGTVPEIVQLANSYDYDINHAGNCIFLVTKAETLAKEEIQKRASAYDAMAVTQMQWHVGGHSYTFGGDLARIRESIRRQTGKEPVGPLKNYADLLILELQEYLKRLRRHRVCRATKAQETLFRRNMQQIARRVKDKLEAFYFEQRPAASYPYYVSKEAFCYAFDLPRTVRIGVLRGSADNQRVEVRSCRATRFRETERAEGKNLDFHWKAEVADKAQPLSREDIVDILVYLGNARSFVVIGPHVPQMLLDAIGAGDENTRFLPQHEEGETLFDPSSIEDVVESHDGEILAWLRNQPERPYESPVQVAMQRLRALPEGADAI